MTKTIKVSHLTACREAVIQFAKAKNIQIQSSGEFRLDREDYSIRPWPFNGLPVVYVAYSNEGRGLFVGYSYNCAGQNIYFTSAEDGRGIVKKDWSNGNPLFLEFHCLSDTPIEKKGEPVHGWMLELRTILNEIIKEGIAEPDYNSVAQLLKSVSMEDIYRYLPWFRGSNQAAALESWRKVLTTSPLTSIASTDNYYLRVVTLDLLGETIPAIDINMVVMNIEDESIFIPLDKHFKDLSFISQLPVYLDDKRLGKTGLALNILIRLSDINIIQDDEKEETGRMD